MHFRIYFAPCQAIPSSRTGIWPYIGEFDINKVPSEHMPVQGQTGTTSETPRKPDSLLFLNTDKKLRSYTETCYILQTNKLSLSNPNKHNKILYCSICPPCISKYSN